MSRELISDEALSPREIAAVLRREIAGHNRRAALLALLAAVAAALLWAALYFVAHWLTLLFLTAARGVDTQVPSAFPDVFAIAAAALLAFAWMDRRLHPDDRPRDKRSPGEIALDVVLAIPRLTLAVWTTLSAWQRLGISELAQAAAFVARLVQERRIRLQSVPLEIPRERARERILYALQILQVIDVRREDGELWVTLNPLRPAALAGAKS